jgi:hypothetical protein
MRLLELHSSEKSDRDMTYRLRSLIKHFFIAKEKKELMVTLTFPCEMSGSMKGMISPTEKSFGTTFLSYLKASPFAPFLDSLCLPFGGYVLQGHSQHIHGSLHPTYTFSMEQWC